MSVNVWINPKSVNALAMGAESILRDAIGDRPGEWNIFILDMYPSSGCVITVEGPDNFLFRKKFQGPRQQNLEFIRNRILSSLPPHTPPENRVPRNQQSW
jgi:hypothetical protein